MYNLANLESVIPELTPENLTEESRFYFGSGNPSGSETIAYQSWPISELPVKLGPDGPVSIALGQQWLVMVVAEWEENFRPRFAAAENVDVAEIQDQCMGDLRLLRNDVVHHRGVATRHNTGRAEISWFQPGDLIHIFPVHVMKVMEYLGLTEPVESIERRGDWIEKTILPGDMRPVPRESFSGGEDAAATSP